MLEPLTVQDRGNLSFERGFDFFRLPRLRPKFCPEVNAHAHWQTEFDLYSAVAGQQHLVPFRRVDLNFLECYYLLKPASK